MFYEISQKARVPFRALFCFFILALFNMVDKSLQTIQMPWTSLNIKASNIDCVHTTTKKRAHAWQFNRPNEIYKNCQTQHTETASMLWSKVGQNCSQRKANKNGFPSQPTRVTSPLAERMEISEWFETKHDQMWYIPLGFVISAPICPIAFYLTGWWNVEARKSNVIDVLFNHHSIYGSFFPLIFCIEF